MTEPVAPARNDREHRLAEALRANLRRRKQQARSRREGESDARDGIPLAAGDDMAENPPLSQRE